MPLYGASATVVYCVFFYVHQVASEDVLAEPEGSHSNDCVWTLSYRCLLCLFVLTRLPLKMFWQSQRDPTVMTVYGASATGVFVEGSSAAIDVLLYSVDASLLYSGAVSLPVWCLSISGVTHLVCGFWPLTVAVYRSCGVPPCSVVWLQSVRRVGCASVVLLSVIMEGVRNINVRMMRDTLWRGHTDVLEIITSLTNYHEVIAICRE